MGLTIHSSRRRFAARLGYEKIYAGTSTANTLLVREGWRFMELVHYNGEPVSIYEKTL